jgi:hypothetical protein
MSSDAGVTQADIASRLGLGVTTIARMLEKLVSYGYVRISSPESEGNNHEPATARGTRYCLSDFYLNFYFSVLRPIEGEIMSNKDGLLFPSNVLQGGDKEYIPSFTGKAFERFVHYHLDVALRSGEEAVAIGNTIKPSIWKKLDLADSNYQVCLNFLVKGETSNKIISQIDVLLVHEAEKSVRVIECKWKGDGAMSDIDEVIDKILPRRLADYARSNILAVSYSPTKAFQKKASEMAVTILVLEDFVF